VSSLSPLDQDPLSLNLVLFNEYLAGDDNPTTDEKGSQEAVIYIHTGTIRFIVIVYSIQFCRIFSFCLTFFLSFS
jgi:hypothetical protein